MKRLVTGITIIAVALVLAACQPTTNGDPVNTSPTGPMEPYNETSESTNTSTQVIDVEAYEYGWDPNPIRVEAGRPVQLNLRSRDVEHGIGIPELGIAQTIPASGETVTTTFTPEEPGEYTFICNVYCGQGHNDMTGTLIVE